MRLPQRQRETLSLRELEGLSYDEIAATMAVSRDTVAQLISRARINLCDELHGTVLASIAAPSPECERALPLIAAREDAQLEAGSPEEAWLDAHLADCDRCRRGVEAMREGGASYRAWTSPAAGLPAVVAEEGGGKLSRLHLGGPPGLRLTLFAGLAVALLLAGLAAALIGSERPAVPAKAAAGAALGPTAGAAPTARRAASGRGKKRSAAKRAKKAMGSRPPAVASPLSVPAAVPAPSGSGAPGASAPQSRHSPGKAAVKPTRQASAPKSQPASGPAAAPTPASAPATEGTPAGEESPKERHRQHEPHGKGAGRAPR